MNDAAGLPEGDGQGLFELACEHDSAGRPALAIPLYRAALARGLGGLNRRRATIQLASSLRSVGQAEEALALLETESLRAPDELATAVSAFRALALGDLGREREALGHALAALSTHLPRYNASLTRYAAEWLPTAQSEPVDHEVAVANPGLVRIADAADAPCLSALATQVFLETYATSGIRLAIAREAAALFSERALAERLGQPDHRILLAERNGHLVAFAEVAFGVSHALVSAGPAAELTRLYVQSPFVRQGLGARLLAQAEALAIAEGAGTLWLTAWVENRRALAFYASRGYEERGATEYDFEGETYENRLFSKALTR